MQDAELSSVEPQLSPGPGATRSRLAIDCKNLVVFWIVFDFYLLKKMDQRTCIIFCVKNEIKCADAFRMLTVAYGEATLDRSNVYRWYKMFSEGREDVNDEVRAGRPSTSTTDEKINEVEKMILANRRITVREVAEDLNISIGSCHSIFINDLGMRRVAAKFVPKLFNCDQKQHRMNIANEMLDSVRDDPNLLQRVITAKTSLQDDDVPIDDTTTKPLFTPQEKRRKETARIIRCPDFRQKFSKITMTRDELNGIMYNRSIRPNPPINTAPSMSPQNAHVPRVRLPPFRLLERLYRTVQPEASYDTSESLSYTSQVPNIKINVSNGDEELTPVPFSIKEKIDKELDRLEKSQIIEKVNASDWSTPLVTVIKSNGELRLCGDFKNTLNNCIEDEKYPLPTIETMLGNLGGNKIFTKLDLSSAYHQIEMDEASKNLLVVSTHRGLYRYNRLPFGISPASAIFQRCMDSLFHDVPNTVIYLDDIFIGSKDEQEHYRILKMIFDKLKELNFTLNKEKCLFLKKDICFLGHIINEDGVRPDSKKLEALERCKKPFDKTSLKSFLGMLSFYSKYIPNMSTLAGPLYQLLKKDNRWKWSSQCEKAFLNLKLTLLNSQALIHYSMKLPLTLTCDASAYGISGVLCHIVEGEEKPITFVSRTLSSAEVKYSQTEKEALAIVFATSKLRQYLFGRKFVLKSDHKALTTVFGNKRLLPPLIANRLHRWALELSNFDFDIRYTNKDTMLCADAFSRLPLEEINSREDNIDLVTHDISFLNVTPLDHLIIEEETNKDPVLNKLKEYLLEDPQLAKKDETMKPFLSKLENFSVLQGCIFVDSRAVIPRTCQDQMLKLLHQSHIGINRMKSLARSSVWWPKMDSQIEEFVKECSPCMHHQTAPPAENTPWPRTNQPWQRVHVDHFYFRGDCYLLVVDANSNWIEVFPVRGTTSQENIKLLRECFARYGLPQCLVSDNGPPFNSIEFKEFLRKNNVYHLTSPAYNPSSNGIAEVSVRIIKKSLEKSLEESPNSNMDCILQNVLFNYRNTPTSLDKPPVERLLSYVPRTFVNCLNSEFIQTTFGRNECGRRHFQVGDKVLFTRVIQNRRKWFKAQVIRRLGYNVYLVKNLKGTFKVHVNQMRTGSDTKYAEDSDWTLDNAGAGPHRLEQDPQISTSPPPRRSTRPRCPPCRFSPTMNNIRKEE
ncbi:K02A2.6-like [Cordylochernes scorpioides]|uniref:RNA-directed DNA polymerase n=1 Tax=Cordylochernes scorpioides TaxID=51811 RepID=A0ABY6L124_9ARAC|nr:K02A2.6-like [Cordylochernes scorpioides]